MKHFVRFTLPLIVVWWLLLSLSLSMVRADTKFDGSTGRYNCETRYPITYVIYDGWFCPISAGPEGK